MKLSRRSLLGAGLFAAAMGSGDGRAGSAFRSVRKAMWVWKDRVRVADGLNAFAGLHNFDTLFVYVSPAAAEALLKGDRSAIANVRALRSGRRMYAMAGEPEWCLANAVPQHVALLLRLLDIRPRLFDGIHLDVEPNALPAWRVERSRAALAQSTVGFYAAVRRAAPRVAIDAALNPIFAKIALASGGSLLAGVARRVQSVSLMSYRDTPERAVAWGSAAMSVLASTGTAWRMGVEVEPNPSEPGTSWFAAPVSAFERGAVALDRKIAAHEHRGRYQGLALHSFDGLRGKLR